MVVWCSIRNGRNWIGDRFDSLVGIIIVVVNGYGVDLVIIGSYVSIGKC